MRKVLLFLLGELLATQLLSSCRLAGTEVLNIGAPHGSYERAHPRGLQRVPCGCELSNQRHLAAQHVSISVGLRLSFGPSAYSLRWCKPYDHPEDEAAEPQGRSPPARTSRSWVGELSCSLACEFVRRARRSLGWTPMGQWPTHSSLRSLPDHRCSRDGKRPSW